MNAVSAAIGCLTTPSPATHILETNSRLIFKSIFRNCGGRTTWACSCGCSREPRDGVEEAGLKLIYFVEKKKRSGCQQTTKDPRAAIFPGRNFRMTRSYLQDATELTSFSPRSQRNPELAWAPLVAPGTQETQTQPHVFVRAHLFEEQGGKKRRSGP